MQSKVAAGADQSHHAMPIGGDLTVAQKDYHAMSQTSNGIDKTGNWIKTVGRRAVLIPTIELVEASVGRFAIDGGADVPALRQALAEQFGADYTCPVTIRRHLKALGIPARKRAAAG